ncbi:MAG: group 1 truncated hemoglobin [Gammaproteobacteria bacterium]|nr:group 1 truncated hemoglobin [Gammaproteobacteria bacterium]NIR82765.1 group 1 truncated hemoglobin [Gammaproteobacteria bacterium]NIR89629.1 group 1 truncated hemoglobin [Gammaproteobacteria bacterium]NIU03925.1 group 1 truncated hemoglobin [Gammaproteobacteria bacterium]NIV51241.1 group 1 truncated hemoglobin [Gammaproteobacteria bacterium]
MNTNHELYEALGGAPAVETAVDLFYRKVLQDPEISDFFSSIDMDAQRAKQKAFLSMVFGGPKQYTGRDLRFAHARLVEQGLDESHFEAVVVHLRATLAELGVPEALARQVMEIVASWKDEVLNRTPE